MTLPLLASGTQAWDWAKYGLTREALVWYLAWALWPLRRRDEDKFRWSSKAQREIAKEKRHARP